MVFEDPAEREIVFLLDTTGRQVVLRVFFDRGGRLGRDMATESIVLFRP